MVDSARRNGWGELALFRIAFHQGLRFRKQLRAGTGFTAATPVGSWLPGILLVAAGHLICRAGVPVAAGAPVMDDLARTGSAAQ